MVARELQIEKISVLLNQFLCARFLIVYSVKYIHSRGGGSVFIFFFLRSTIGYTKLKMEHIRMEAKF